MSRSSSSRLVSGAGLLDQAWISAAGLITAILVGKMGSAKEFGTYAVAVAVVSVVQSLFRSMIIVPYLMQLEQHSGVGEVLGTAVLLVGICSGVVVVGGVAISQTWWMWGSATVVVLFGSLVLDACRFELLRQHRAFALVSQLGVNASAFAVLVVAQVQWGLPAVTAWLSLGVAQLVAGCVGVRLVVNRVSIVGRQSLRRDWRRRIDLAIEGLALTGTQAIAVLVLGVTGQGPVAAQLRAAQVLLGPVSVISQGFVAIATPMVLSSNHRHSARLAIRKCMLLGVALFCLAAVSAAVIWLIPKGLGLQLFSGVWELGREFVPGMALALGIGSWGAMLSLAFRVLQETRSTMFVRVALFPVIPTFALLAAPTYGANGVLLGFICSNAAALLWLAIILWSRVRGGRRGLT